MRKAGYGVELQDVFLHHRQYHEGGSGPLTAAADRGDGVQRAHAARISCADGTAFYAGAGAEHKAAEEKDVLCARGVFNGRALVGDPFRVWSAAVLSERGDPIVCRRTF